jgi:hypothetical protein
MMIYVAYVELASMEVTADDNGDADVAPFSVLPGISSKQRVKSESMCHIIL